jgi:hypothetical protein
MSISGSGRLVMPNQREHPQKQASDSSLQFKHHLRPTPGPLTSKQKDRAPFPHLFSIFPGGATAYQGLNPRQQREYLIDYLWKADAEGQLAQDLYFTCSIHDDDGFHDYTFILSKTTSGIVIQPVNEYAAWPRRPTGVFVSQGYAVYNNTDPANLTTAQQWNMNQIIYEALSHVSRRSFQT